jgi:hypothetical protein
MPFEGISIKPGVRIRGLSPPALLAINIAAEVYRHVNEDFVITSVTDGDHKSGSLHHVGDAFDLRLPGNYSKAYIANEIQSRLGSSYDVVLERDHIHVEYDPD